MTDLRQNFLKLTPSNREAKQAFNDVALKKAGFAALDEDLDCIARLEYAEKFMVVELFKSQPRLENANSEEDREEGKQSYFFYRSRSG
jgi:hypothetical protein